MLGVQVRKNSEKCIGGLLSFNPSTMGVTQLLEGPAAAVRALRTAMARVRVKVRVRVRGRGRGRVRVRVRVRVKGRVRIRVRVKGRVRVRP